MDEDEGWAPELAELRRLQAMAADLGGPDKVAVQHAKGKLTVRERIAGLLDPGTFREIGSIAGVATYGLDGRAQTFTPANSLFGRGRIEGRPVVVYGDDFTVRGGS